MKGKIQAVLSASALAIVSIHPAQADSVIFDDQVVAGSSCIGQDCSNGENFAYDVLRLKENNLRIRFVDTSNSASFPTNDWEIIANDVTNGGMNYFSIADASSSRQLLTLEAGAPANSIHLSSAGKLGLGTAAPLVDLHVASSDSPALRLEQQASGGFSQQSWDVAGNESSFFVRDVTNGSTLPLRIESGAPNDALVVDAGGNISSQGTICANSGGVNQCIGAVPSSISLKQIVEHVDTAEVLEAVAKLSMPRWFYNANGPEVQHIGPIAEEFQAAFGLNGGVSNVIAQVDLAGVALASIQELNKQLEAKDAEIAELKKDIADIKQMLLDNKAE